jgi:hypothetical protein
VLAIWMVARFKISNNINVHIAILAVRSVFGDMEVQGVLQEIGTAVGCSL